LLGAIALWVLAEYLAEVVKMNWAGEMAVLFCRGIVGIVLFYVIARIGSLAVFKSWKQINGRYYG